MGTVSLPGQMNVVESRCSMLDHVNLAGGMNTWETNFGEVKGRHSETCVGGTRTKMGKIAEGCQRRIRVCCQGRCNAIRRNLDS